MGCKSGQRSAFSIQLLNQRTGTCLTSAVVARHERNRRGALSVFGLPALEGKLKRDSQNSVEHPLPHGAPSGPGSVRSRAGIGWSNVSNERARSLTVAALSKRAY